MLNHMIFKVSELKIIGKQLKNFSRKSLKHLIKNPFILKLFELN